MTKKRKYDKGAAAGFFMALPCIIGLCVLNLYPLVRTVYMSFFKSGSFGKWTFIGLDNYTKMFSELDFWYMTKNTVLFMIYTVPPTIILALVVAVLLNQKIKGKTVFRAIYFLPMVCASAAVAMVWKWLYNAEYGIINMVLGVFGIPGVNWISNPKTALFACAMVTVWSGIGYDAILILSGLQSISASYYEAARIDGASPIQQFFKITVPLVSPTLFFVLIMRVMGALKVFDIVYMMIEKSNPAVNSCKTILYVYYEEAFVKNNKGYGSAIVVWNVLLIALVTLIQFVGQKKWVTYDV